MTDTPVRLDRAAEIGIAETLQIQSRRYAAPIWWCGDPYDANTVKGLAHRSLYEAGGGQAVRTVAPAEFSLGYVVELYHPLPIALSSAARRRWLGLGVVVRLLL